MNKVPTVFNFYLQDEAKEKDKIYILGDITSWKWFESDVTAQEVIDKIAHSEAKEIDVYISSYGGDVSEGLAIYNALKQSNAKVTTYCLSFACSIASVIFMAGTERKMSESSLLMIHNAWRGAVGNANELEKAAQDLRIVNEQLEKAYMSKVNISGDELKALLNNESWITPEDAKEKGFATEIIEDDTESENTSASAKALIFNALTKPVAPSDSTAEKLDKIIDRLNALENRLAEPQKEPPNPKTNTTNDRRTALNNAVNKFLKKEG